MNIDSFRTQQLTDLMSNIATQEGISNTALPTLSIAKISSPVNRMPLHYKASLCFVFQGQKQVFSGEQSYTYDPLHYLVIPMALPLEMAVTQATAEKPMLGMALELDLMVLSELLISINSPLNKQTQNHPALFISKINDNLQDSLIRLLKMLNRPADLIALGDSTIREILYWVLQSEQGDQLRQLVNQDSYHFRIANIINYINQNFEQQISIDDLSGMAHMSGSALHQKFKQITSMSPLQYLKKIRLHNARNLMLESGMNASDAGFKVGYTNSSQFSREFKRLFGLPPVTLKKSMI